ncbi:MAG: aspartate kinase [Candidatus Kapabacteria bacterium]|nr:aspartate kinase [Candidatus Kapabacteria bacterium]
MLILKFGGTSVKDDEAFARVLQIIQESSNSEKCFVVLSASATITDSLIMLMHFAVHNDLENGRTCFEKISLHHLQLLYKLIPDDSPYFNEAETKIRILLDELQEISKSVNFLKESTPRTLDKIMSYGELLSTTLMYYYLLNNSLNAFFVDAREIIATDSSYNKAKVDFEKSKINVNEKILPLFDEGMDIGISQGFIGANNSKQTTTLGRGGSDYTASLFGKFLNATEIQIWTDVDGILSADPRLIKEVSTIPVMEFNEMRSLAYFGAKVVSPDALIPAIEANIPIKVLNTFSETLRKGTYILPKLNRQKSELHSVMRMDVYKINFSISKLDNFLEDSLKIITKIQQQNGKIYSISILPDKLTVWIDKATFNKSHFSTTFSNYSPEICDDLTLFGLVGINLNNFDSHHFITRFHKYKFEYIEIGVSPNEILISIKSEAAREFYREVNQFILANLNVS